MRILLLFLFFFLNLYSNRPLIDISKPEKIEGAEFLLTYPKSGTNWTMALIQILTSKPIKNGQDLNNKKNLVLNRLNLELDKEQSILYRTHHVMPYMRKINSSKNKLLLVLRNYKECILRANRYTAKEFHSTIRNNKAPISWYLNNLIFYDEWEDETKLLIYYEDLIQKPRQTIEKLLIFFEEGLNGLDEFMGQYGLWRKTCLVSYQNQHSKELNKNGYTSSGGNKEIFHSKDFPPEILHAADKHISENHPDLWEKYLKRYKS